MSQNAVTRRQGGWALFLDVDGTIVELAETPRDVRVPADLKELLSSLSLQLDGALALVSGRTVADLDALFAPFQFCVAGVHGCERRDASGHVTRPALATHLLDRARDTVARLVRDNPGLLLEDKQLGLAVHFRRAPHLRQFVAAILKSVLETLGPAFCLQQGKCVYEIRPATWSKGSALSSFMSEAPFRGRIPVFVGDDLTDEDAFAYVNQHDGLSLRVGSGSPSAAQYSFANTADVLAWLRRIPPFRPPHGVWPC
jgi:trehalose 6-phosphate phosphatase